MRLLSAPDAIASAAHQNFFAIFAAVRRARDLLAHAAIAIVATIIAVIARAAVEIVVAVAAFVAVIRLLTVSDRAAVLVVLALNLIAACGRAADCAAGDSADNSAKARAFATNAAVCDFAAQQGAEDAADHSAASRAVIPRSLTLLLRGDVLVVIAAVLLSGGRLGKRHQGGRDSGSSEKMTAHRGGSKT